MLLSNHIPVMNGAVLCNEYVYFIYILLILMYFYSSKNLNAGVLVVMYWAAVVQEVEWVGR